MGGLKVGRWQGQAGGGGHKARGCLESSYECLALALHVMKFICCSIKIEEFL